MPDTAEAIELAKYWQEWWKIGISALTPVAIAGLTFFVTQALNEQQSVLRKGEQILSEKQKTYSALGENLNIIYIYISDIGDFREYNPEQILETKSKADRVFHMYRPYWSDQTAKKYAEFMNSAFAMFGGNVGVRAKIKTTSVEKKAAFKNDNKIWAAEWDENFTNRREPNISNIYEELISSFLNDIATVTIHNRKQKELAP